MKPLGKLLVCAAGILGLSLTAASAATVSNDLNLRSGPGTNYGVIAVLPQGASVDVGACQGNWCQVNWRGRSGFASASYLSGGGGYAVRPEPRVYQRYSPPPYRNYSYYDPNYYDRYYYRRGFYGPGVGFSLRF